MSNKYNIEDKIENMYELFENASPIDRECFIKECENTHKRMLRFEYGISQKMSKVDAWEYATADNKSGTELLILLKYKLLPHEDIVLIREILEKL